MLVGPLELEVDRAALNAGSGGLRSWPDNFVRFVMSGLFSPVWYSLILSPFMKLARRMLPNVYRTVYPADNDPDYAFHPGAPAQFKPWMVTLIELQLARIDAHIDRPRRIAEQIKTDLADVPEVRLLHEEKHGRPNYSYFGLTCLILKHWRIASKLTGFRPIPESIATVRTFRRSVPTPASVRWRGTQPQISRAFPVSLHQRVVRSPNSFERPLQGDIAVVKRERRDCAS